MGIVLVEGPRLLGTITTFHKSLCCVFHGSKDMELRMWSKTTLTMFQLQVDYLLKMR